MSTSTPSSHVKLVSGDLLESKLQTIVNTVNTVGVMGKGIALAFKKRYPEMYDDYVARCDRGEVRLGEPYVYRASDHVIVNFPTKRHWRSVSRLSDIVAGLESLEANYRQWGITSIAVPPLGCGNGQLEWEVVGPTLHRHLARLDIPVELYASAGVGSGDAELDFLIAEPAPTRKVPAEWVAMVAVLDRLQRQHFRSPVGRVMFQKLVYFGTEAGIPSGLAFERGSYGPFSADLNRRTAQLQNNGLVREVERGQMLEVLVGPTYVDAVNQLRDQLEPVREAVLRTVDLMARMDTHSAEVAATVHFVVAEEQLQRGTPPTLTDVLNRVEAWKPGRFPAEEVVDAVALLCMRGWSQVAVDQESRDLLEERLSA